jgi:RimJ/RimL family protein N-acetyltransferase
MHQREFMPAFDLQPTLRGELIVLRPAREADRAPLFALASDPEIWAMHPAWDRYKPEVFDVLFDEGIASGGALIAINRADGAMAGWSRFSRRYCGPNEIEIGWTFLARRYWGGAHNREMKHLMLTHAFGFVDQVQFRVGEHNLRSRRAVEKLGARLTLRSHGDGNVVYVITKSEFLDR